MTVRILTGDCRATMATLPAASVQTCVTSPPYFGLRDYGHAGQIGMEPTPDAYVAELVAVFREVRRVLRDDGTVWLNLGDSYVGARGGDQGADGQMAQRSVAAARCRVRGETRVVVGLANKNLIGIPWRVAFALQADGWYLRSDIIWAKPNPMPESVTDRPTKAHEYLFLLTKSPTYYYDAKAIAEESSPAQAAHNARYAKPYDNAARIAGGQPGNVNHVGIHSRPGDGTRNKRSVWTVSTTPFPGAHFATFPPALIEPCILAGSKRGDTVLDPFGGAGTTGLVADRLGRDAIICELNPDYAAMAERRIHGDNPLFTDVSAA